MKTPWRKMRAERHAGRGVRLEEWRLTADESSSAGAHVLDWCRDVVANCRRPFGLDSFDLAVAVRQASFSGVVSHRFLRLRPLDLYSEGFAAQLTALSGVSRQRQSPVIIAAAIFSWGDAAHRALPTQNVIASWSPGCAGILHNSLRGGINPRQGWHNSPWFHRVLSLGGP